MTPQDRACSKVSLLSLDSAFRCGLTVVEVDRTPFVWGVGDKGRSCASESSSSLGECMGVVVRSLKRCGARPRPAGAAMAALVRRCLTAATAAADAASTEVVAVVARQ